jgi:diaminopimelate epimerase
MPQMPFIKMHGCGNDYVYIDCFENPAPKDASALAALISDRHRSIGSDGLVLMLPPDTAGAAARMRMFNADGSEGALCGNALRCMAMWLYQSGRAQAESSIAMADRLIAAEIRKSDERNRTAVVRVTIGQPIVLDSSVTGRRSFIRRVTLSDGDVPELLSPAVYASFGNPHTILFVKSLADCNVHATGRRVEHDRAFANRTNVEFVQTESRSSATVRVWERGSGETLACGSGACAVAVAGIAEGLFDGSQPVTIHMPGGELRVQWDADNSVCLEGPAQESFRGTIEC